MNKIEKLRKKAEDAWTDCDSCNSNDKSMWINGYLVGALANQIELPTNQEIDLQIEKTIEGQFMGYPSSFRQGAQWMRDKIKGGKDE